MPEFYLLDFCCYEGRQSTFDELKLCAMKFHVFHYMSCLAVLFAALSSCDQIRDFSEKQAGSVLAIGADGDSSATIGEVLGFVFEPEQVKAITFTIAQEGWYHMDLSVLSGNCALTGVSSSVGTTNYGTNVADYYFPAGTVTLTFTNDSERSVLSLELSSVQSLTQGSLLEPYALGEAESYNLQAGATGSGNTVSYYSFTVSQEGIYQIQRDKSFFLKLYGDAGFASVFITSISMDAPSYIALSPGTYYLQFGSASASKGAVSVKKYSDLVGEGTSAAPVELTVDAAHQGKIGYVSGFGAFQSYYQFTVEDGVYSINFSKTSSDFNLHIFFSPGALASGTDYDYVFSGKQKILSAGTYYLEASDATITGTSSFDLQVSRLGEYPYEGTVSSPVQVVVGTSHDIKTIGSHSSYYRVDVEEDGLYACSLDTNELTPDFEMNFVFFSDAGFTTQSSPGRIITVNNGDGPFSIPLTKGSHYFTISSYQSTMVKVPMTISRTGDLPNEGSIDSPVSLSLGTTHAAKTFGDGYYSYYQITISQAGTYSFLTDSLYDMAFALYGDDAFSSLLTSNTYSVALSSVPLAAGTYYLKISNEGSISNIFNLTPTLVGDYIAEGSVSAPVSLDLGSSHAGKVGASSGQAPYSYYQFTAGTSSACTIAMTDNTQAVKYYVYSDAGFTTQVAASIYDIDRNFTFTPNAGTTYYLKVGMYSSTSDTTYTLTVSQ